MAPIRPSLPSLPPELIEEIIVISTLLGDTRVPATLAQTCHPFRALVYHQLHKCLWREMFLVVFDDPRPARSLRYHGRAPWPQLEPDVKGKCRSKNRFVHDYPWEDEYKLRIWTESFILRRTRRPSSPSFRDASPDLPSSDAELCTVIETLLRVVMTSAPLPYDTLAYMASRCHPCAPLHPHPIFSPLFLAAHTQPALVLGSRNTTWLARVLAHGFPRVLMARLSAFDENDEVDIQKTPVKKWDGLLAKLVAQIGLMTPVSSTTPCTAERSPHTVLVTVGGAANAATSVVEDEAEGDDVDDGLASREGENRNHDSLCLSSGDDDDSDFEPQLEGESDEEESESDIDGDEVLGTTATSATISQDGVRRLARVRAYNMAYLHPSRAFGPFLPIDTTAASSSLVTTEKPGSGAVEEEEEEEVGSLVSPSTSTPPVLPIPDTNCFLSSLARVDGTDIDDAYFLPFIDDDNGDSDDGETAAEVDGGSSSSSSTSSHSAHAARRMIPGEQLRFDWAWIAAARQVIELNLRDLLVARHQGVLRALLSLEGLRSCSAPGFSPAVPPLPPPEVVGDEGGLAFKDGEGWDWAGVEGQWRRCVCWLDYRDLLSNNAQPLSKRFSNPALYEVMRIIPLTLRITHYTRAPAAWPGRPTIHVSGDWYTATTSSSELAHVRGTVEMAASGDVRWTLISFREDGQGQWCSEGVQLGGRGSAMGVIGMWTGAEHEPSDPLGPFWAWKVGPANNVVAAAGTRVVHGGVGGSHGGAGAGGGVR